MRGNGRVDWEVYEVGRMICGGQKWSVEWQAGGGGGKMVIKYGRPMWEVGSEKH